MNPISVILLQKNRILRHNIADFLIQGGLLVLNQASSISEMISQLKGRNPNIVLLDIELVGDNNRSAFNDLRKKLPKAILILTGPEPRDYYAEYAKEAGVDMYLSVEANPNQWKQEIQKIIDLKGIKAKPYRRTDIT